MNLGQSTVDTENLGLSGVQAIGQSGTEIGSGSAHTSLADILSNTTNTNSEANPGTTTFFLKGPVFQAMGSRSTSTPPILPAHRIW